MSTRDAVLDVLERRRGEYVSGAALAKELGISRNAVWKAIKILEAEGYSIDAVRNKGYSLETDSDILSVQGLKPFLASGMPAEKIHIYRELASTNITAKEMAVSGEDVHGSVVIADSQTSGRGRRGRSFFSPAGGIYASFIIKPEGVYAEGADTFTVAAAVAVCEAVENVTGKSPGIKWINDVLLDGRKICGILTESAFDMESRCFDWIVIGIGINFSIDPADFPDDIKKTAGSLYPHGSRTVTRNMLTAELINCVFSLIVNKEKSRDELLASYKKRLTMLGSRVNVFCAGESYSATALDLNENGNLIVKKDDGTTNILSSGEISVRSGGG